MYRSIIIIIFNTVLLSSCGIYSFNGASIPKEANTITIEYFTNKAPTIQPMLSQIFTEKLKDRFIEQTDLVLSENGDLSFNGYISNYNIQPIAITSNETASKKSTTRSLFLLTDDPAGSLWTSQGVISRLSITINYMRTPVPPPGLTKSNEGFFFSFSTSIITLIFPPSFS